MERKLGFPGRENCCNAAALAAGCTLKAEGGDFALLDTDSSAQFQIEACYEAAKEVHKKCRLPFGFDYAELSEAVLQNPL